MFIGNNKIDVVAILQTKVKMNNMDSMRRKVFRNWEFVHNNNSNPCC